jgi:hypothetical protein
MVMATALRKSVPLLTKDETIHAFDGNTNHREDGAPFC